MAGAGFAEGTGERVPTRGFGKVIPYEEFLQARAARNSTPPAPSPTNPSAEPPGTDPDGAPVRGDGTEPHLAPPGDVEPRGSAGEPHLLSDVRAQKLERVRSRIREGYYDRPEVLEETVQRVLASLEPFGNAPARKGTGA